MQPLGACRTLVFCITRGWTHWCRGLPSGLHRPKPKKRKKDIHGAEMAAAAQSVIDEYIQGGWEVA